MATKKNTALTSLSCSMTHADAVRHAAIGLKMTKKAVLEALIEGSSAKVRKAVNAEYARLTEGDN